MSELGYKRYRSGTHRTLFPAQTLARVRPHMAAMGITRIANITGLDRIGIPVVMVTRPNSRSLSVSQGKGLDLDAAKASGLMEAVETYHAENIAKPLLMGSWNDLQKDRGLVDVAALPQSREAGYHPDRPMLWIEGMDQVAASPVWIPYELIHTNYTLPRPADYGCFPANTNGLASGNHLIEAINHGICEVIERDANTLWHLQDDAARAHRVLALDSIDDSACRDVLERFKGADIDVIVWDTTTDVGVAAFQCLVIGRDDAFADPEFGAGCHPSRAVALLRALTEAAQARTTYIAGSRDDYSHEMYTARSRRRRLERCRALLRGSSPAREFSAVPDCETDTLEADNAWLLERLQSAGIRQVAFVDLTKPEFSVPVVRVVVPGLEGPDKGEQSDYVPGLRAGRILDRKSQ